MQSLALLPVVSTVARIDSRGLSLWSLHVLTVFVWVPSGHSGFLPQTHASGARSIGHFFVFLCEPRDEPAGIGSCAPPRNPVQGHSSRRWMAGCNDGIDDRPTVMFL